MTFATADLIDDFEAELQSCETQFRQFGGLQVFSGRISTIRCFRDNGLVKKILNSPGEGRVLVVDGGDSLASALCGDLIAKAAVDNGWSGLVINGVVRDTVTLATLRLGVKALGSNPKKSAKDGAGEVDVPVSFGGVDFRPGAWLYSDHDGIVVADRELPV
ncbi:ribonuclease E activity regulator RraA [Actinocorallia longicatena]|uniref:4-hydroxy-4-methyl-2-oxoglutarate aldolase n=1 Tax=Actinocorallia longicatena TaxID=111803 RepID=A0ABP6Q6I3_9ACTN